jgi:5'-phosphate synthase pdxT subunit
VLALQGDFEAHAKALAPAQVRTIEVRTKEQLAACDGLILPGGESTTMLKLLHLEKLWEPLREFGREKPIFGTCAGTILLAREVSRPAQESLDLMDLTVERNGYGRQIDSRVAQVETEEGLVEAVFIRAPVIRRAGPMVHVLATYQGTPIWVEQGLHMATTFHPELSEVSVAHERFLKKVGLDHSNQSR